MLCVETYNNSAVTLSLSLPQNPQLRVPVWLFTINCPLLQEYLSHASISSQSQLELTNASHYCSLLNMTDLTQRKVVTALSQHLIHGTYAGMN